MAQIERFAPFLFFGLDVSVFFTSSGPLFKGDETSAFIHLIWNELFDETAPDSFQPKLQNVPALVSELQHVASLATGSPVWTKHVTEIQAELARAIEEHAELLEQFPRYDWALRHLVKVPDVRRTEVAARRVAEEEPPFSDFYEANLHRAVDRMPKAKELMALALGNLASYATHTGLSRQSLRSLARIPNSNPVPHDAVAALCLGCRPEERSYQFIAAVDGDADDIKAILRRLPNVRLLPKSQQPTGTASSAFLASQADATLVTGTAQGEGSVNAAKEAARAVRSIIDTFNFYCNSPRLSLRDAVLLVSDSAQISQIDLEEQSLRRLAPRKDARHLTQQTVQHLIGTQLTGRLLNALELHSLAHGSGAGRVRLVNLWSAIECLLGSTNDSSIIDRVCALVVPIVVWRRVEKVVRYLAISTHLFRSISGYKLPYSEGFENSDKHSIACEDLLHILSKPQGHPHLAALTNFVAEHPLLRYRLFRAWQSLKDPAALRKELLASENRVRAQLFRIYRARNLIIHHGDHGPLVGPLLDTLQYYLSAVLTRVLGELAAHPTWLLEDALFTLLRETEYFKDVLSSQPKKLVTRDFLLQPRVRISERLWL